MLLSAFVPAFIHYVLTSQFNRYAGDVCAQQVLYVSHSAEMDDLQCAWYIALENEVYLG